MLALSAPQFTQFNDQVRERAHERMVAHLTRHFPLPARLAGPAAVGRLVDDCFAEAGPLGLHRECDLTFLMSLKLYFGAGFRSDRQCEPFAAILGRDDVATPEARIGRCWREGMAHHDAIAGEDGRHLDAAITRLAGRGLARLAADDSPLDSAKAQALLAELWPEKAAWMAHNDPKAPAGLMAQVSALAGPKGVTTRGGARLLLALCWVFGSSFATDPMLTPLAQLLSSKPPLRPPALAAADSFLAQICQQGASDAVMGE